MSNRTLSSLEYSDYEPLLRVVLEHTGGNGKPQQVTRREADDIIKKGGVQLYRGVYGMTDEEMSDMVNQFKGGDLFYGQGIYGSGTYTSNSKSTPKSYTRMSSDAGMMGYAASWLQL